MDQLAQQESLMIEAHDLCVPNITETAKNLREDVCAVQIPKKV